MINIRTNTLDQCSALSKPLTNGSHYPHRHQPPLLLFILATVPIPEVGLFVRNLLVDLEGAEISWNGCILFLRVEWVEMRRG